MSQFVEITLDKPRQFRFRAVEARDACNTLSNIPGKGYVNTSRLLAILGEGDYDAWTAVLVEGLKHEDPTMRRDRALNLLMDAQAADPDIIDVLSASVIKAGQLTGVFRRAAETAKEDARGKGTTPNSDSAT